MFGSFIWVRIYFGVSFIYVFLFFVRLPSCLGFFVAQVSSLGGLSITLGRLNANLGRFEGERAGLCKDGRMLKGFASFSAHPLLQGPVCFKYDVT